jgi:uncharacterized membrane protein
MILQFGPDTPILIRAAAATVLTLHIGGASLGILSGGVALIARKGHRLHRAAGNVFFVSMLTMSAIAAAVAPMLHDRISGLMGLFTFYLTSTAWAVVWRGPASVGRFETGAGLVAFGVAVTALALGVIGSQAPGGLLDGQPSQIAYILAIVAALGGASDIRMIRRGGMSGAPRIARHLWRMCLALFIAAGSAAAQPKVVELLPKAIRGSPMLVLPALAVLVLMVFWLFRTRFTGRAQVASSRLVTT